MAAFVSVLLLLGLFPSFISIILAETVRKELRTKESIDDNFIQVEQPLQYNRIDPSRVIQLSWRPRVFLYQGFLSNVECDHLISLAKRKQENSAGNDGNFQDDVIAARIEDRMSAWTFLPKENSKPMQILHFGCEDAKQKYDYFGNKSMSIQNEPLMATVILYLSDVTHGGQILFPELKDEDSRRKIKIWSDCEKASIIRPIKGNALLFFNTHLNASPDKSSSHVRCPVLEGELWSASGGERERERERMMWLFSRKGPSGFSAISTAEEVTHGIDGAALTAIVTGASSGIGSETARVLALRGVHVVMGVRNMSAAKEVKEAIIKQVPSAKIEAMELDLSSLASVRTFASEFNSSGLPLNILINNAGIMATPFMLSQDKIELQFATNHLGHFLLTNLLLGRMKETAHRTSREGRIVNVSSRRHKFSYPEGIRFEKINDESGYNSLSAYGQSKLSNVLHANELARRLKVDGTDITVNSIHPGAIATNLFRHSMLFKGVVNILGRYLVKGVQQGAATTCYVALHPDIKGMSGKYFSDCNIAETGSQGNDTEMAKKLWDLSLGFTD